jgi:hypothetical protein
MSHIANTPTPWGSPKKQSNNQIFENMMFLCGGLELHGAATYRDFPYTRNQELPTDKRRPSRYTFVSVWSGSVSPRRIPLRETTQGDAVMALAVSDKAIRTTRRCRHDFACLDSEGYPLCSGEFLISENGLFIRAAGKPSCLYSLPFSTGHICNCPVRIELYTYCRV